MPAKTNNTKTPEKATKVSKPKAAKASATTKRRSKKESAPITHDDIALGAFILWQQRGGDPLQNWLDAERQLR